MDVNQESLASRGRLERIEGYLEIDPGNRRLLNEAVALAMRIGWFDKAMAWSSRASAAYPDEPAYRYDFAYAAAAAGDADTARRTIEAIGAEADGGREHGLAQVAFYAGDHAGALQRLDTLAGQGELAPESELLAVRCLHHLNQVDAALRRLSAHLARHPDDGDALGLAALLAFDAMRLAKARTWSEAALARDPGNLDALVVRGALAFEDGDQERAAQAFGAALAMSPTSARAWLGMGLLQMSAQQPDAALQSLARAVQALPSYLGARVALAWCHVNLMDLDAAVREFDAAMALNRNFAEIHGGLAVVYLFQGRTEEAQACTERALGLDPNCIAGLHARALLDGSIRNADGLRRFSRLTLKQVLPTASPDEERP